MSPLKEYIDIVVVAYKSGDDLEQLLGDLGTMGRHPFKLHLFDNSENTRTLTALWNDLANEGRGKYLAFLNTDIRISPEWDARLVAALERDPAVGVAIPRPVGHDWPALAVPGAKPMDPTAETQPPSPQVMARISEKLAEELGVGGFAECNAAFYAVMMNREIWDLLKGFDERFRFYGQDHDFQRRMKARTGKLAARVVGCPVWHKCGGSVAKAQGEVDFNAEMIHQGVTAKAIQDGDLVPWDWMSDAERKAVRANPLYGRMPLLKAVRP